MLKSFSRLFVIYKGYRIKLVFSQVLLFISALCMIGVATLTQRLINEGIATGDIEFVLQTGIWMAVLAVIAEPGQKIGICGPTGAGKSTIMNILTRYYDIDSGTILIDGQNLKSLTQESLRSQVGMVLQEAFLFSDTVMNNLKYAREGATDEACIAAAKQANAHEFIKNLPQGYDTMMVVGQSGSQIVE